MKGRERRAQERRNRKFRRNGLRCQCGASSSLELALAEVRRCPFAGCVQFYCSNCGRGGTSFGPVGCPCSMGRTGHGRYAEQPKPHAKVKQ